MTFIDLQRFLARRVLCASCLVAVRFRSLGCALDALPCFERGQRVVDPVLVTQAVLAAQERLVR